MKNALKCGFELLDLVQNWENGTNFSEKGEYLKKCLNKPHSLSSNPWLSVDITSQKINTRSRFKKISIYLDRRFSQKVSLNYVNWVFISNLIWNKLTVKFWYLTKIYGEKNGQIMIQPLEDFNYFYKEKGLV